MTNTDTDEAWQILSAQTGTVIATHSGCPEDEGLGSTCGTQEYGMTGGGNYVIVEHKDQNGLLYYTLYCHLIEVNVEVGQEVKQGDVLGIGGNSGNSTGRHLHFELRLGSPEHGNSVDPMPYFSASITEDKKQQMTQAGISVEDQKYADYIIEHESSWNYQATNPTSGAYGLCQALPPSKMETAGTD